MTMDAASALLVGTPIGTCLGRFVYLSADCEARFTESPPDKNAAWNWLSRITEIQRGVCSYKICQVVPSRQVR